MGKIDISAAKRPTRGPVAGTSHPLSAAWEKRVPPAAQRRRFIRRKIYMTMRDTLVNPVRTEIADAGAMTREIKEFVLGMGADAVGVAEYDPRFTFEGAETVPHRFVIVFAMAMKYDVMADVGAASQDEVHRVYNALDALGISLTHNIGAYGYGARLQPNDGEIPLIPYAWLAGLGELGKHGSLISPRLGSSFRLSAVSTDLPLAADGPQDYGIDEICTRCTVCTRFCPGEAIRDEKREAFGIVRWRVNTPACEPYFHRLYGCKLCLMVCPFNAKGLFRDRFKPMAKNLVAAKDAKGLLRLIGERNGEDLLGDPMVPPARTAG